MRKLIDQYGRRINYLRISVTDRCNLRCVYCIPKEGFACKTHDEILRYEEILKVAKAASFWGINKIRITGGEPLRRRNILYFLDSLIKIKGIDDVSLTTNGTLLSDYATGLKKSGLKRINISLDTLDREKYKAVTGSDMLDNVWRGINDAFKVGLNPVKINVVVMKGINDNEIEDFARLTLDNPLHIRFIEFIPIGNGKFWTKDKFISNDCVKNKCENIGELLNEENYLKKDTTVCSYRFRGAKGTISFISPISKPFCSNCSRLRLTSEGKFRLCLGAKEEIDIKPVLRTNEFSSQKLKNLFLFAAALKPAHHCFNLESEIPEYISSQKTMCQIGG